MSLVGGEARFPLLHGDPLQAWPLLRQGKAVLIGETLAHKANLGVGDRLAVSTPGGEVRFPIVGVYYDYSPGKGLAVVDFEALGQHFGPGPAHSLALYLQAPEETDRVVDQETDRVVDQLKLHYAETPLRFRSNRNLRQRVLKIFDQTFAITRLLQAMCLLIAVCGITLTLLILARERISELALYRAFGALRRQIFWVFVGKGLGIGLLGLALGTPGRGRPRRHPDLRHQSSLLRVDHTGLLALGLSDSAGRDYPGGSTAGKLLSCSQGQSEPGYRTEPR